MSMNSLAWLLGGGPSGVYRITGRGSAAHLPSLARLKGMKPFQVNCSRVHTKQRLLSVLAHGLGFPSYFGENWDALMDCLTDMSWAPADGYVILLSGLRGLAQRDYFTALDVLEGAAVFWADNGVPFYVLLEGTGSQVYLPEIKAG
jgi:hypothetical protein